LYPIEFYLQLISEVGKKKAKIIMKITNTREIERMGERGLRKRRKRREKMRECKNFSPFLSSVFTSFALGNSSCERV